MKKTTKKVLSLALSLALTICLLAGCGGGGSGTAEDPANLTSAKDFTKWFQEGEKNALSGKTEPGTYYFQLGGDVTVEQVGLVNNGHTVIVDLNGHTITGGANQVFSVAGGGKLTLKNGTVQSAGADADGGVLRLEGSESQLNLEDVTLNNTDDSAIAEKRYGGVIYACGFGDTPAVINVKGNTTINGSASAKRLCGGAVALVGNCQMFMQSGTIQGGKAGNGGNIYADEASRLYITGGTVTGGETPNVSTTTGDGGNIYLTGQAQVHFFDGTITAGTAKLNGGNVFVACTGKDEDKGFYQYSGLIENGVADNAGGNIYAMEKSSLLRIYGGSIKTGTAKQGGNVYLLASKLEMRGGEMLALEEAEKISNGGNICSMGGVVDLYDGVITKGTTKSSGANIYGTDTTLRMYGGSITYGASQVVGLAAGGGNIFLAGSSLFDMYGGEIAYGTTNSKAAADATTGPNVMIVGQTRMQMFGGSIHDATVQGVASRGSCVLVNGQAKDSNAVFHMYGGTLEDPGAMGKDSWGHLAAAYSSSDSQAGFGRVRIFDGELNYTGSKEAAVLRQTFHGSRGHADNGYNMFLFDTSLKNWTTAASYVGACTDRSHNTKTGSVEATCVTPGYTQYHCNTCGDWCKITSQPTGHEVTTTEVAATEQLPAYNEHSCSKCGVWREIPAAE